MSHPKGVLLERAQRLGLSRPDFRTERTGPEHEPSFISDVMLDGEVLGTGQGGTKRTAEKHAAEEALAALEARSGDGAATEGKAKGKQAGKGGGAAKPAEPAKGGRAAKERGGRSEPAPDRSGGAAEPRSQRPAPAAAATGAAASRPAAQSAGASAQPTDDEEVEEEAFDGPWPMFDDLLAAAVGVAERRVFADLRGEEARVAIRDFSLALYKELLLGLGDLVEDDEEDEEEEED